MSVMMARFYPLVCFIFLLLPFLSGAQPQQVIYSWPKSMLSDVVQLSDCLVASGDREIITDCP